MTGSLVFFAIVAAIVLVAILKTAVIVPQKTAYIVERLGRYRCTLDAGFHILIPFLDRIAYRHTLKEQAIDVPPSSLRFFSRSPSKYCFSFLDSTASVNKSGLTAKVRSMDFSLRHFSILA